MNQIMHNCRLLLACSLLLLGGPFGLALASAAGQERAMPLDDDGKLVNFQRDIAPIFRARCLECHEGNDAKAGFAMDDRELVLAYIEPEDPEVSTIYIDYLVAYDESMLMPPKSHGGPLSPAELALIRQWISEGASWPEEVALTSGEAPSPAAEEPVAAAPMTTAQRVWAFQGYFHPATVHFPIALLTVGALFVVLGLVWPKVGTQIPLACLLIGSLSAVVASTMGWAFAAEQGYPGYEAGWEAEVNSHRWSGIIVTGLAAALSVVALIGVSKSSKSLNFLWKGGLIALAAMIGLVGHQGGEMTYPGLYERAFSRLNPVAQTADAAADESDEPPATGEQRAADPDAAAAAPREADADVDA